MGVRLAAAILLLAAPLAAAQPLFYSSDVSGDRPLGAYFNSEYTAAPGQSWAIPNDHLVLVSRAEPGTVVLTATLAADTAPRTALGTGSQVIAIKGIGSLSWLASDTGPASEELTATYSVPWDKQTTIFSAPLLLAFDIEVLSLYATCGTTYPCTVRHTRVVLPPRAAIAINGVELPRPTLLPRDAISIPVAGAGINPFAEWESIAVDDSVLRKVAVTVAPPAAGQWYRTPGDPLAPSAVVVPGADNSIEKFLGCSGGGCAPPRAVVGIGQDVLATGRHTITLRTRPYSGFSYTFYDTPAVVGSGSEETNELSTEFILFGPRIEVTPAEAGPGQTIRVRGSGFAPDSTVSVAADISASSRHAALGMFDTDETGSFDGQPILPPAGDPFFTDVVQDGPRLGSIRVDVDDVGFLADYFQGSPQYDYADMTFVPTATAGTTTTTLPGGGPPNALDPPECATTPVPPRAAEKFASAAQGLDVVEQMIAETVARKGIRKLIGKADASLKKVRQLVNRARKRGEIPAGCAFVAIDLIDDLRARAQAARDSLKR
jgi:hypothetical protein